MMRLCIGLKIGNTSVSLICWACIFILHCIKAIILGVGFVEPSLAARIDTHDMILGIGILVSVLRLLLRSRE